MKRQIGAICSLSILIVLAIACNGSFTTANISALKFGRNDRAEPAETTFKTGEDIYALAVVSNAGGKYKLNWKFTYEDVPGKEKGEEIGTKTVDFEGSKQLWQQFSSPLPGEYKAVATLTDEAGKEIDKKEGLVTITGSAPSSSNKKGDDDN